MKLELGRTTLATALAAGLPTDVGVIDHLPDSITPPVVMVAWSDPWLTPSTLCEWEAKLELLVVAQRIEPGGHLTKLEEIVSACVPIVKGLPFYAIDDVTSPYPLEIAGVQYLAASINITHETEQ